MESFYLPDIGNQITQRDIDKGFLRITSAFVGGIQAFHV